MNTIKENHTGRIVALAGGVGGAKLAHGLSLSLAADQLTVIVNTGDDFEHLGLRICPDVDTVSYTLAGLANPATGWGRRGESYNALEALAILGGPAWFRLGDHDLGTHLERTRRLREGQPLSRITRDFCHAWGVDLTVLPMTDDSVPTWVYTDDGDLPFQEYFVRRQCRPRVKGFRFEGVENASPAPGVLDSLQSADLVIFCPSNPWVSLDPILALPGIRQALAGKVIVAVSPIIGGETVKGPAAKMYAELGIQPSALAVARHYGDLLSGFIMDAVDMEQSEAVAQMGIEPLVTETLMKNNRNRRRLAGEVLKFGMQLSKVGKVRA
jgi:LPPG:FO 2-phospho-L-lactate transferase